jgi:hypothetical protein
MVSTPTHRLSSDTMDEKFEYNSAVQQTIYKAPLAVMSHSVIGEVDLFCKAVDFKEQALDNSK